MQFCFGALPLLKYTFKNTKNPSCFVHFYLSCEYHMICLMSMDAICTARNGLAKSNLTFFLYFFISFLFASAIIHQTPSIIKKMCDRLIYCHCFKACPNSGPINTASTRLITLLSNKKTSNHATFSGSQHRLSI